MIRLLHGDCLDRMRELDACSIDAIVTYKRRNRPHSDTRTALAWLLAPVVFVAVVAVLAVML